MVRTSDILKASVLIADDQVPHGLLLERLLRSAGYTSVASTSDPREVCELHRRRRFELIVLGLDMRGLSGFEVIQRLKDFENEVPLPALAIAAPASERPRAVRAGINEFICKPFERFGVLSCVRDTLRARLRGIEARHHTSVLESAVAERIASLRATEDGFRLMVQSICDCAIVQLDPRGRIRSWNRGAELIGGWSAAQVLGRHHSLLYTPADIDSGVPQRHLEMAAAAGRQQSEGWHARRDGTRFWATVVLTPYRDANGALRGFARLTCDVTEGRPSGTRRKQKDQGPESTAARSP